MIRINLLPKTINTKRILRNTAILFGVLLVAVLAGGMTYGHKLDNDRLAEEKLASDTEAYEKKVKDLQAQAQTLRDSIKPIKQKLDFINAVIEYNGKTPKLYKQVAAWTYEKITYKSMAISSDGASLTMDARAKSLDDVGRYLLNMYRATDLFTEVTISGVPGYESDQGSGSGSSASGPDGGEIGGSQASLAGINAISNGVEQGPNLTNWIEFTVSCKLKTPITAPSFGAASAATGTGGVAAPAPSVGRAPAPPMTPAKPPGAP